jgi:hypothetical protein
MVVGLNYLSAFFNSPASCIPGLGRGIERDHVFIEPKQYVGRGTARLIRDQSRQRFGRSRGAIERQRHLRLY